MQNTVNSPTRLIYLVLTVFIIINLFVPGEKNNLVYLLSQLVVYGFTGIYLVFLSRDKKNYSMKYLLALLIIAVFVSLLNSLYFYDSLRTTIQLFSMILLAWLVSETAQDERTTRLTFIALVVTGVIISAYGLLQVVTYFAQDLDADLITRVLPFSKHYLDQVFTQKRIFATFQLPTTLSAFIAMILPLAGGLLLEYRKKLWAVVLLALAMVIMLAALVQTQSNGGAVALIGGLGLGTLIVLRDRKLPVGWILLGIIAAGFAAIFTIGFIRGNYIWDLGAVNSPIRLRALLWQAGLSMLAQYGLTGLGAGNFHLGFFQHVGGDVRPTKFLHNTYLQFPIEFGIVGLVVLAGGLYFLVSALLKRRDEGGNTASKYGLIIAIIVFLVANFFEIVLYFHSLGYLGAFLIGLYLKKKAPDPGELPAKIKLRPAAVVGGVCCLIIMLILGRIYLAEHLYNKASDAMASALIQETVVAPSLDIRAGGHGRDWSEEIDLLKAAIAIDSSNYKYHILLAQAMESSRLDFHEVQQAYKAACDLSPLLPNLHYSYGVFLLKNQKFLQGSREIVEASRLYPDKKEYAQAVTLIERYLGKQIKKGGE